MSKATSCCLGAALLIAVCFGVAVLGLVGVVYLVAIVAVLIV